MSTKRITRPLANNIIIEVVLPDSVIVMPDEIQNINDKDFVVVSLGPDCKRGIEIGDIVQASDMFRGLPTGDGRERHFICSETDIEGIIELVLE